MQTGMALVKTDTIAVAMLILVSCLIFFVTALALVILRIYRPTAQYAWLVAVGGAMLALASIFIWLVQMPLNVTLPAWQPERLFGSPAAFHVDGISWPYAVSISTLTLAVLLTSVSRPNANNSYSWAGTLALAGLGILAVTADNPITLLLAWAALDLVELVTQLSSVEGPASNEKVVTAFSTRVLGIGLLLWANIVSRTSGNAFSFDTMSPATGLYLIAAAGLRLGVLPLHLPYPTESTMRRDFGTSLRLVSAASSLALLEHVQSGTLTSAFTPFLFILALIAGIYGGWMWLRAPDELTGRPFWIIGIASLSVISALSGNPLGSVAWGCALILLGGTLFLSTVQQTWLNRLLLLGVIGISALPFSLTASAWMNDLGVFYPFAAATQALLMAGYIRHNLRTTGKDPLDLQPNWVRMVYPGGIGLLVAMPILLGLIGWDGARQIGAWLLAVIASVLTFGLFWAIPRFRIFNPVRAHWVPSSSPRFRFGYDFLWGAYRFLSQITNAVSSTLEGDGGLMWTLLSLILFISILTQGTP
jgi:hypothetical protein